MKSPRRGQFAFACAVVVVAIGGSAGPAFAHVEPDPESVPAGSTATITFNLEHGCGESNTVKLEMKLGEGVTDPKPASIDGWTSSVAGDVITWTGGPQPHDEALLVPVEMTFPNTAGATLLFPLVQTCEQGEIRWIDPPNPDGSEPEDPAPVVTLTAAEATTTTTSATTTGAVATSAATTAAAATTATSADSTAVAVTIGTADEGSDNTAAVIAVVAIAIIAVVGVGAFLLARSNAS